MDNIKELQKELHDSELKNDEKKITNNRGRLINKIRQEIKRIKADGVTKEEQEELNKLEDLLTENITEHKEQLSIRYKEEFVNKSGSLLSTITALPKGVSLAIKKVKTCIADLKDAKDNKEKTFKIVEVLKSSGLLVATPLIFTGKFLVKHWYLVLLFLGYLFNIPGLLIDSGKDTIVKNAKADGKNIVSDIASDIGIDIGHAEKTTFWNEIQSRLRNPEYVKNMKDGAKERLVNFIPNVKNDIKAIKDAIQFIRNTFGSITGFLKGSYGPELTGLDDGIKNRLATIRGKIQQLSITSPNAINQINQINQEMYEVTGMLAKQPVPNIKM